MFSKRVFPVFLVAVFLAASCITIGCAEFPRQPRRQAPDQPGQVDTSVPRIAVTMMKAQPESYSGACPTVITFKGHIAAAGTTISPSNPVTVKYVFIRSDGATGPVRTVTFTSQGAQTVSSTWQIGGPGFSTSGWQALRIISPDPKDSKKAYFSLHCNN
ncbi:MAG: hypothetical protein A4E61_00808 [Syntrophorhabdus sp. PtaB.Bin184]|jgi:hypothetical protein|nr:MAG: hypothetical protein A4E61_00808 [Syntrophorhabdus sp. PtaB.Bin184]